MSLTSTLKFVFQATLLQALDLSNTQDVINVTGGASLANGTGADQADMSWSDTRSVAAGANDDLDLAGSLTNAFGATLSLARIKAIYVKNKATAGGATLLIGAAGSQPITSLFGDTSDKIKLAPQAEIMIFCPTATAYAVGAGSADKLRIAHDNSNSTSVSYDICIVGATS